MADGRGKASRMRDVIRIERPVADDAPDGAGSGEWATVADQVSAEVLDMLPSRGERLAEGVSVATRPARVRIRYRDDVTTAMRFVLLEWRNGAWAETRLMQIVAGPAEIGERDQVEFMVEDYSPAGNPA